MPYSPPPSPALFHKFVTRTAGNLTLNSTAWAAISTGLDLAVPAVVGDVVEVAVTAYWSNEAVSGYLDAVSMVSGSPVNYWASAGSATGQGIPGLVGVAGVSSDRCAGFRKTIVSGDLAAGLVTVRIYYRTSTANPKTVFAVADLPFQVRVTNLTQAVA